MKTIVILLFASILITGCKGKKNSSGWPQKERDAFSENCVKGASAGMGEDKAKSYCSCMLGKVEVKYPDPADVAKLDVATMTEMAKDCLK